MSGSIIDSEYNIFTVPNPELIGPLTDRIDLREGVFEVLNVTGTFTTVSVNATSITVTNASITNLNVTALNVANLGANAITPSPAGSGVSIDGVVIRDRAHYTIANRSVATVEGANPASTSGVSVGLVPVGTGALIGAFPDGTAIGGNTRGDFAVDWQLARLTPVQVSGSLCSTISGGAQNSITPGSDYSTIGGGADNAVNAVGIFTATSNVIGGGVSNVINATTVNAPNNIICGGQGNTITDATGSSIVGALSGIIVTNNNSFIGGGASNSISGAGDSCVITGGFTNVITVGSKNGILSGQLNTISNSNFSAVIGGFGNTLNTSSVCIVGGQGLIATNSSNCLIIGTNSYATNSPLSYVIGQQSTVLNSSYGLAMGYAAVSNAFMAHTFSATDALAGGANIRPRSHKFNDSVFEVFCTDREIHNRNTHYVYFNTVTVGAIALTPLFWILIEPYQCVTTFIHITGGGGNNSRTALGYGYTRCYWRAGGVVGTNWFNNSVSDDGGFGWNADVAYSGSYMAIRIVCGVAAGIRCNWTVCVTMQIATWLL